MQNPRTSRSLLTSILLSSCTAILMACGGAGGGSVSNVTASSTTPVVVSPEVNNNPVGTIPPGAPATSDLERAFAIAAGIVARQQANGSWQFDDAGTLTTLTDAYQGQAGILFFLCKVYQNQAHPELKKSILAGAAWLTAQNISNDGPGLFNGQAGVAYAYLSLYETFKDTSWLDAAITIAKRIENDRSQLDGAPGDMIAGHVSNGLFFLKLYELSKDQQWLAAAKTKADESLSKAIRTAGGIKFETALSSTNKVSYVGFAHGAAGAGYFYASLAQVLGQNGSAYQKAAQEVAVWLRSIATTDGIGVNWYRREPDQLTTLQNQWCHGAPGIGLFFSKLYELSKNPQDLAMAKDAAATALRVGHSGTSLCHGIASLAQLYLRLFRLTGDTIYLQQARAVGEKLWTTWNRNLHYPSWMGDDGSTRIHNASLMTGNAGRGYLYLQLNDPQHLATPFLE